MPTIEAIRASASSRLAPAARRSGETCRLLPTRNSKSGQRPRQPPTVTETAARRQLSAASSYQRLREQVDQTARSATAYQRAMSIMDRASARRVLPALRLSLARCR